jgi:hypothetical protein
MLRMQKTISHGLRNNEISLHRFHQRRSLRRSEGRLRVRRTIRLLKTSLNDHIQVASFDAQDAEYEFAWPFDNLKHLFIDFTKGVFWDFQKADYEFPGPFANLKHQLSNLVQVDFNDTQDIGNKALRHLVTSRHRLHQSRFLRRPKGRLWVLRAIRLLKTSQETSSKPLFSIPRMQKMSSHGLSTPWYITWSTSPKSVFKTSRRLIVSSKGHSPT